jgi:hypothetical protein
MSATANAAVKRTSMNAVSPWRSVPVRRGPELVFNHEVCQIIARGRAGMSW